MQKRWKKIHPFLRRRGLGWLLIGVGIGLALAAIPGAVWVAIFLLVGGIIVFGLFVSRKFW